MLLQKKITWLIVSLQEKDDLARDQYKIISDLEDINTLLQTQCKRLMQENERLRQINLM